VEKKNRKKNSNRTERKSFSALNNSHIRAVNPATSDIGCDKFVNEEKPYASMIKLKEESAI
jgi:hypothetical protein